MKFFILPGLLFVAGFMAAWFAMERNKFVIGAWLCFVSFALFSFVSILAIFGG